MGSIPSMLSTTVVSVVAATWNSSKRLFGNADSPKHILPNGTELDIHAEGRRESGMFVGNGEVEALRSRITSLEEEVRTKSQKLELFGRDEETLRRRTEDLQRNVESLRQSILTLEEQLQNTSKDKEAAENELHRLRTEHGKTIALLTTRTAELKGAEAFLTKADAISGGDIIAMVEQLNAEVLQNAALMAESFAFGEQAEEGGEEVERSSRRINNYLGPTLIRLLKTSHHHKDPTLVQFAFQACMMESARWIITTWSFDNAHDDHLIRIFGAMLEEEPQAVFGRHRALTRRYAHSLHKETELLPFLVSSITNTFYDILVLVDCKNEHRYVEEKLTRFRERAATLVKLALRLNKAIGEDVTSADFEVFTVPPEVDFNSETMEDEYGGDSGGLEDAGKDRVLCTTDMGLRRFEKISQAQEEKMHWKQAVLLKPKVALISLGQAIGSDN